MMFYGVIALLALSLAPKSDAQIPLPCAGLESMTARECCPKPTITGVTDPGQCGSKLERGRCSVIPGNSGDVTNDVRQNWPLGYFNRVCKCEKNFGGYDCGECSFGYTGIDCTEKVSRSRRSLKELNSKQWTEYHNILNLTRNSSSRYKVVTIPHTNNVQALVDSMVNPTLYQLFVWMHHFVAKDNNDRIRDPKDFAHESTGFPTWHRLYLLWLEREIQQLTTNPTFTLHYWDWRDPGQRTAYFTESRLGANNNNGEVEITFFKNWNTVCWNEVEKKKTPPSVPICTPTEQEYTLRRCPIKSACNKDTNNWPTFCDVQDAVSITEYDARSYDQFIDEKMSFRNYMEGFIAKKGKTCEGNKLCTQERSKKGENYALKRKLHNSVHVILGIGDFESKNPNFYNRGVMADVAASPNDPIFINHHTMVDCILEAWLQKNKKRLTYPASDDIHDGHKANSYIVPFIPLYTHSQMFQTADNFGYECSLSLDPPDNHKGVRPRSASCESDPDPSPETNDSGDKAKPSFAGQVYLTSLLAALLSILVVGNL